MSPILSDAPTAETLTLFECLGRNDAAALTAKLSVRAAAAGVGIPDAAVTANVDGLRRAFGDTLAIPVGEMFKAACLRLAAPRFDAPTEGGDPSTLTLASMVVESSHHPNITLSWGGVSIALRLTVDLSLEINGAQLLVESLHIVGARTGTTLGTAKVSYLSGAAPLVLGTPEFKLPGELRFARSVAIAERS